MKGVERGVELVESPLPEPALPGQPILRLNKAAGHQFARAHPTHLGGTNQTDALEGPQVLHERRQRHGKRLGEFTDGTGPTAQTLDDGPAGRVGEGLEDRFKRGGGGDHGAKLAEHDSYVKA